MIAAAVCVVLCWLFPPFSIRSRTAVELARATAQFNAKDFVAQFWNGHLANSLARADDAATVLAAIAADREKAREQFGRTAGISSTYTFYLRGTGRVVNVSDDQIGLAVTNSGDVADIMVPLGLVFGNAVRDGTGLLDASSFPNAQQFNDVAAGLNQRVETQVLPELQRIASVGRRVTFVGCAEVGDEGRDLRPLKLVPVFVQSE